MCFYQLLCTVDNLMPDAADLTYLLVRYWKLSGQLSEATMIILN